MAFAGDCGIDVDLGASAASAIPALFSEELGLVLEVDAGNTHGVLDAFRRSGVPCEPIGAAVAKKRIRVRVGGETVLDEEMGVLRDLWEATSFELERLQADPDCVAQERTGLRRRSAPPYALSFVPQHTTDAVLASKTKIPVAIVREEGSNGDREMTSAFYAAGFEPWDVVMSDLRAGRMTLERFRGLVFVGGFSFADVLDSAKGWAGVIRFNDGLRTAFDDFAARPDTFSLGVCNGCQLMALLGWVPWSGIAAPIQPRFVHNASGRFESRFTTVQIQQSPAIMFSGMERSTLGVWVAHGEGRAYFPDPSMLDRIETASLAPVRFVDDQAKITEAYPFNPNGSPRGIAALCSPDGRHLAMMPHPERTFQSWQWGWMPTAWRRDLDVSPWLRMFQNAREWCERLS